MKGSAASFDRQARESFERYGRRGPNDRGEYSICCPLCTERHGSPDTKFKLGVRVAGRVKLKVPGQWNRQFVDLSPTHATWGCFRCGARGVGDFTWLVDPEEAATLQRAPEPEPYLCQRPDGFIPIMALPPVAPARQYLNKRHMLETAQQAGLGFCVTGPYRNRIIIPVRTGAPDWRWLGFVGRDITGRSTLRYRNDPGMPKGRLLYGAEFSPHRVQRAEKGHALWLVEGPFDALALFPYGISTMGTGITDEQIEMFCRLVEQEGRTAVVGLDGDAWIKGAALAQRIARQLGGRREVGYTRLPPAQDPGSLRDEVKRYRQDGQRSEGEDAKQ